MRIGLVRYRAGNILSVRRAVAHLGYGVQDVASASDVGNVDVLILPGVGHFGQAAAALRDAGLWEPTVAWLAQNRPFLGICVGFQLLFSGSDEAPGVAGLGRFPAHVRRFESLMTQTLKVPQIGWNSAEPTEGAGTFVEADYFYFVNSYCVAAADLSAGGAVAEYGGARFVAAVEGDNLLATQFHLEKSGEAGLRLMRRFLESVQV